MRQDEPPDGTGTRHSNPPSDDTTPLNFNVDTHPDLATPALDIQDDDLEWFVYELNEICDDAMETYAARRNTIIKALNNYRRELDQVAAPSTGPAPFALESFLEEQDNRLEKCEDGSAKTILVLFDELVQEACNERNLTLHEVRRGFKEFALAIEYFIEQL